MRAITALLTAALFLSGCGDVYINGGITVNHFPSKTQEKFPRGKLIFACYSTDAVMNYVENGSVRDCGWIEMTGARKRSEFYTSAGVKVVIYEFYVGTRKYFTLSGN